MTSLIPNFLLKPRVLGLAAAMSGTLLTTPGAAAQTISKVVESRDSFKPPRSTRLTFGSFGDPSINKRGDVAFFASVSGRRINSRNNTTIVLKTRGKFRLIAQENVPQRIRRVGIYNAAALGRKPIVNDSRRVGWFSAGGDALDPNITVASTDDSLNVATPRGRSTQFATLTNFSANTIAFDFNRKKKFSINAIDSSAPTSPLSVVRIAGVSGDAIASVGEIPPGLPVDTIYDDFGEPTIADNNNLFFMADISDLGSDFDGIWYGGNDAPIALATIFQNAPTRIGVPGTQPFQSFDGKPGVGNSGDLVAFAATVNGNQGIYQASVSSGQASFVFDTSSSFVSASGLFVNGLNSFLPPAINDDGDIAFLVAGSAFAGAPSFNTTRTNNRLIYIPAGGTPQLIIGVGQSLTIEGESRTVTDVRFGSEAGMNESGQIIFEASFTNQKSGIYIFTP